MTECDSTISENCTALLTRLFCPALSTLMRLVFLAPVKAQSSGVLLGIVESRASTDYNADGMETVSPPRYQSARVAPNSSGNLSVLATIPQLIVPRRDGF